jgi:hypothetical protein
MPQEVIIVVHLLNLGDLDSMHKLNLKKDKLNKLGISEIELLLIMEMGFISNIKKKVNRRPSSNQSRKLQKTAEVKKENFVDQHLEIVKKVDELIDGSNNEIKTEELETVTKIQQNQITPDTVQLKESFINGHESHIFQTELEFCTALGDLAQRQEFFEVEAPTPLTPDIIKVKEGDFTSKMVGDKDVKDQKTTQSIGKINFIRKSEKPKKTVTKNNGVTKTKNELEKTKAQIESKKKELEEAIQKEKEKELELKQKEVEKRKREKLKKLNLKKKMKEEKQKEKERELELKRKEEEKQKREKLKQIELKKKMKEEKQKEKLKEKKVEKKIKKKEIKKPEKPKKKKVIKPVKKEKQEKQKEKNVKKPEKKDIQEKPEEKKIKPIKKKEEKEPEPLDNYIKDERPKEKEPEISEWDEDVERLLPIIDKLFDKLPDDVVDEFAQSEDFSLYEKVVLKYKNK